MAQKFYVVWQGRETGIFTDWTTCKKQIDRFAGARYKSFPTREEAEAAFAGNSTGASTPKKRASTGNSPKGIKTYAADEIDAMPVDIKIFTDGGCEPNPGKAGSGLALYRKGKVDTLCYGLYTPKGTNNSAELNALHQALLMAREERSAGNSVAIFCDSKYAIQCITQWAISWEKKGWTKAGGEIKNLALIQEMFALHRELEKEVKLLHVNGHVGVQGNELADRMSMLAIERKEKQFVRYAEPIDIAGILAMRAG